MSTSKNVGQVSGLFIGTSAPQNKTLIWFDSTTNQQCHKVYDPKTGLWKVLDPEIVALTTYSELVNNAKKNGLSIGKFYQITDKSNTLAITVGVTKVQYIDTLGNILIDDLGTNIQYHVSSGNLLIDDIVGVFDVQNNKLVFSFDEQTPTTNDYLFGKKLNGSKWNLFKFKISSLISNVSGNSIIWNKGLFFNFYNSIKLLFNKSGGIVSYDTYKLKVEEIDKNIKNASENNQTIVQNAEKLIKENTSPKAIYDKNIPKNIDTEVEPGDVLLGDTLFNIISKFQRWINKFKYATGIRISRSFKENTKPEYINNNDTVESALSKVQYWLKNIYGTLSLSNKFKPATDPSYDTPIPECAPNDAIETAISKIQGILNDIGTITDGKIKSKQKAFDTSGQERGNRMEIDFNAGSIQIKCNQYNGGIRSGDVTLDTYGFYLRDNVNYKSAKLGLDGLYVNGGNQTSGFPYSGRASADINISGSWGDANIPNVTDDWYAGLYAWANNNYKGEYPKWVYGAYIEKLCAAGLVLRTIQLSDTDNNLVISDSYCYYSCYNKNANLSLSLPTKPQKGQCLWIRQVNPNGIVLNGNGHEIVKNENSSGGSSSVTVSDRGSLYFLCFDGQYWMMNKQNQ